MDDDRFRTIGSYHENFIQKEHENRDFLQYIWEAVKLFLVTDAANTCDGRSVSCQTVELRDLRDKSFRNKFISQCL